MAKKTQKRLPRRREEFTYRGYRIEDLQQMGASELVSLMPARARRKVTRGLSRDHENFLAKVRTGDDAVRTHL
ncbi:MAG TPA: 30S ribosomal protein S19, partial [Methanofollis liminatans]|nr:30S ribosomal protein S19 [Methanofollis liminatans]